MEKLSKKLLNQIVEEFIQTSNPSNVIKDIDKTYNDKGWGVYCDGSDCHYIVKCIKGRGFPKIPEEEKHCIDWNDLDVLFWEDVNIEIQLLSEKFKNFVVVGRSGGYWGFYVDYVDDYLIFNKERVYSYFEKYDIVVLDLINKYLEKNNITDKKMNIEDFVDDNLYELENLIYDKDYVVEVDMVDKDLQKLDKEIESTIDYFENKWFEENKEELVDEEECEE